MYDSLIVCGNFCDQSVKFECFQLIQKLSTRLPSLEIRQRVLQEIATEKGIKMESNDEISFHTPATIVR
jgi:hypothetical protein